MATFIECKYTQAEESSISVGLCLRVVLDLMAGFEWQRHKLYTDNYYTSPQLYQTKASMLAWPNRRYFPKDLVQHKKTYSKSTIDPMVLCLLQCGWTSNTFTLLRLHIEQKLRVMQQQWSDNKLMAHKLTLSVHHFYLTIRLLCGVLTDQIKWLASIMSADDQRSGGNKDSHMLLSAACSMRMCWLTHSSSWTCTMWKEKWLHVSCLSTTVGRRADRWFLFSQASRLSTFRWACWPTATDLRGWTLAPEHSRLCCV